MQILSMVVVFVLSLVVGVLAHRSPKRDWEFIKDGPLFILLVVSTAMSQVEFAQQNAERLDRGRDDYGMVCNNVTNEFGIIERDCEWGVVREGVQESPGPQLGRWLGNWLVSTFLDAWTEMLGLWLGIRLAGGTVKNSAPA